MFKRCRECGGMIQRGEICRSCEDDNYDEFGTSKLRQGSREQYAEEHAERLRQLTERIRREDPKLSKEGQNKQ